MKNYLLKPFLLLVFSLMTLSISSCEFMSNPNPPPQPPPKPETGKCVWKCSVTGQYTQAKIGIDPSDKCTSPGPRGGVIIGTWEKKSCATN